MLKRAGIDPIRVDPRPLSEIMNDEIPYERWDEELCQIKEMGHQSLTDYLKAQRQK